MRVFYGWWIVLAAFLNLFFSVGIVYYGFPVFYPSMVDSLGFTRAQLTQGFLLGFVVAALLFGILAVVGYVLTGPIPNQVLISNWFRIKRGRAMGGAYLGLGVGGAISPLLI